MGTKENTSEEIDLGQLFKLVGDGINRLFLFIGAIFKGIFHSVILFLQFLRKHFLKFVIAAIIGLFIGWYFDATSEPIFRSSMIVEPNFNSTQQLYNNIEFYNELAREEDYNNLAAALKVSNKKAETIKSIMIEAFTDENQKLKQFSDFVGTLDSTSRANLSYKEYLNNFNNIQARFHKINIEALDPEVAKTCQNAIVRSITSNDYFQLQKVTNDMNLKLNDSIVRNQLIEIDSLKLFYKKIKLLEVQKEEKSSRTSINLSSENQQLDQSEIVLLKQTKSLSNEIFEINERKADTRHIINVISDFPFRGALIKDFFKQKKVVLPILFIGLTFLVLVVLSLNSYLKKYNA
ncbi:hypothetical protein [Aquimarina sp. RZ0]|uniref:hypothetical protein n=1 Tax=Aquimarina sp. RZ0 TaxID=2607730 RepID=UPI0011F10F2A|nr:hypothetical protein [Aquimarina sp. RZ0]KAA1244321.1 hypothetical protein F0000_16960 [Aquimarina sp. RZ0]